jgi:tetratricopeptide (TPR) repeat protein
MRLLQKIIFASVRMFAEPARYGAGSGRAVAPETADAEELYEEALGRFETGRYGEALDNLNRLLEMYPDHPQVLFTRAATYDAMERYDEALADYDRILSMYPDDPDTLNNKGNVYLDVGRLDEAWALYHRALQVRPNDPCTIYNLACVLAQRGDITGALSPLAQAIELDPKYAEMAKSDPDLEPMRKNRAFRELVGLPPAH